MFKLPSRSCLSPSSLKKACGVDQNTAEWLVKGRLVWLSPDQWDKVIKVIGFKAIRQGQFSPNWSMTRGMLVGLLDCLNIRPSELSQILPDRRERTLRDWARRDADPNGKIGMTKKEYRALQDFATRRVPVLGPNSLRA